MVADGWWLSLGTFVSSSSCSAKTVAPAPVSACLHLGQGRWPRQGLVHGRCRCLKVAVRPSLGSFSGLQTLGLDQSFTNLEW